MKNCIFCKIINGEIPSYKIYDDEFTFAILDINPTSRGHVLVLPKKHFDMTENTDNEILEKMIVVSKNLGKKIRKILKSDGFNININNDKYAGQEIMHTHFHIVQRFDGDGLKLWKANENEKSKVGETYNEIIKNLK
ncbi:MAG TPA: HIT family protein [bacterium]|nr:HIT family protein [bacterium]